MGQLRSVRYDDERACQVVDFRMGDVFATAILAVAAEELADLGEPLAIDRAVADQRQHAARARQAVLASIDPASGLCRDWDALGHSWTDATSLASFSALVCGGSDDAVTSQREMLTGPSWAGHPRLRHPLPPSQSPDAEGFQPRTYWRGPIWPVITWLFCWAAVRRGDAELAATWRQASLEQLADGTMGEYYEPMTGEPLGSRDQSWTAAVALDWLADPA